MINAKQVQFVCKKHTEEKCRVSGPRPHHILPMHAPWRAAYKPALFLPVKQVSLCACGQNPASNRNGKCLY